MMDDVEVLATELRAVATKLELAGWYAHHLDLVNFHEGEVVEQLY